jgi:hypothetical protein
MAANCAALNNYLDGTLGIMDPPTIAALNAQGLDSFNDSLTLTEEDVTDICSNVRKPGGTIPNSALDPANIVAGIPVTIPNPCVQLGHMIHEKRLKITWNGYRGLLPRQLQL